MSLESVMKSLESLDFTDEINSLFDDLIQMESSRSSDNEDSGTDLSSNSDLYQYMCRTICHLTVMIYDLIKMESSRSSDKEDSSIDIFLPIYV